MKDTEFVIDKFNATVGLAVAIMTYIFGDNWFLFAAFLFLNVCDEITGWYKAYVNKKENSETGWRGVLRKFFYWVMIALSFLMSAVFIELGATIGINLHITTLFGWFVLASLFINEIRSIIENLVEAKIYVPPILTKGLKVADELLKEAEKKIDPEDDQNDAE